MELIVHLIAGIALCVITAIVVYKLQYKALAIALVMVLSALFLGLSYFYNEMIGLELIITGAVFGYVAKRFSFQRYFITSVTIIWLLLLIIHYMLYFVKGIDAVSGNQKIIEEIINASSVPVTEKQVLSQQLKDFLPLMRVLMPFSYFFSSAAISILVYAFVFAFFVRFKFLQIEDSKISLFRVDEWVVFLLIASWLVVLLGKESQTVWAIALNIGLVLCVVYTIQGISVILFLFEKKQWPKLYGFLILFVTILLGFQVMFFVITMLMGIGIIDFWMNFRKIA